MPILVHLNLPVKINCQKETVPPASSVRFVRPVRSGIPLTHLITGRKVIPYSITCKDDESKDQGLEIPISNGTQQKGVNGRRQKVHHKTH